MSFYCFSSCPWALLNSCTFGLCIVRSSCGEVFLCACINFLQGEFCMLSSWDCVCILCDVSFQPAPAWEAQHVGKPVQPLLRWLKKGDFFTVFLQYLGNLFSFRSHRVRGLDISCVIHFSVPWRNGRERWHGGVSWGDYSIESLICKQGQLHNLWDQGLKEICGPIVQKVGKMYHNTYQNIKFFSLPIFLLLIKPNRTIVVNE